MLEKTKQIINKNIKWIAVFFCVIIFLEILEDVFEKEKLFLDTIIYQIAVIHLRTQPLTTILKVITNLGGSYVLITIALLSLLLLKNKKIAITINLNLIISVALNSILKNIIQRPRPEGYRLIDESGYSFPSGHSMVSMAFYGLLIYLLWKKVKNKKIKYVACTLLGILILMIGFSRIYLGVHYASDVIGGFVIAIAYLVVFTTVTKSILEIENMKEIGEMKRERYRRI